MELLSKPAVRIRSRVACRCFLATADLHRTLPRRFNHAVDLRLASFCGSTILGRAGRLVQKCRFTIPFSGPGIQPAPPDYDRPVRRAAEDVHAAAEQTNRKPWQMKMMNYMMIFMGVMFLTRFPAGTVRVILSPSSLWGMGERKAVGPSPKPGAATTPPAEAFPGPPAKPLILMMATRKGGGGGGLWSMPA